MASCKGAEHRHAAQFGHGGEAVENVGCTGEFAVRDVAGLQFGHGGEAVEDYVDASGTDPGVSRALQFGHGGEAVENIAMGQMGIPDACDALQFGHGGEPWKTHARPRPHQSFRSTGFNSATAVRPWKDCD